MSKPLTGPPPGFDDLSVDDQIEYVQSLWDRIRDSSTELPVPDWHREIIRKRLADLEAGPDSRVSWSNAQKEIARRLDQT